MAAGLHSTIMYSSRRSHNYQLVTADYNIYGFAVCLECCLQRTKRTVVVNTEGNTPDVWGAVRVATRGHTIEKKVQSNQKPRYNYQRSPCLPGLSDKRAAQV